MEIFCFDRILNKGEWISKIDCCDWKAAGFLAGLLRENRFYQVLGNGARLYIMAEAEKLVSFAVLSPKDCIDDDSLTPWIGFVYTAPEYRGNRYSGEIISHLCGIAGNEGHKRVYIATDHIGLYEKYGFTYMENRIDVWGEDSRIYYIEL